jgi:hypothetical protein
MSNNREQEDSLSVFLDGLTELSRKHGVGIAGSPVLFVMESDDQERAYACDAESNLSF